MFCRILLVTTTLTLTLPSIAQSLPNTQSITSKVIKATTNYQAAISCSDLQPEPKNIAALVPYKTFDDRINATYAAFWVGDIGCAGGSSTSGVNVAIVTVGAADTFLVDPLRSSPAVSVEFPSRGYERIVGNTKDSIIIDAAEHGPNDANCCPSIRFRYTLKLDEKGNWKQTEKKSLPPKK